MGQMKYLYKNIICYQSWGTWQADYEDSNGNRFALHRCCNRTKTEAMEIAKTEVDYLNGKGDTYGEISD